MRVLITTTPGCGHLFPMIPLAWALRCAGHQVLVAGPKPVAKAVRAAGLEHAPVGGDTASLEPWPDQTEAGTVAGFTAEPWVELAEHTVAETIDLVGQWRPQVVVSGYAEHAGPIAAALSGLPSVCHHWGLHISDELAAAVHNEQTVLRLHALQERFGLLPEEATPAATIDLCPASLCCFDSTGWLTMRHIPYGGAGVPAPWLWTQRTQPRVCVSMGSVPSKAGIEGLRLVASGLSEFDGEVVLTGLGSRGSALGELPRNVRTTGWLPHDQLLPTCDLVVHHGGSGTAMNSLVFGLPQLVLPHAGDQFENAERLVSSGAARAIGFDDRSTAPLRREVERLLTEPAHREHARRLRAEIETMQAPGKIVAALEELAATHQREGRLPSSPEATSPLALAQQAVR